MLFWCSSLSDSIDGLEWVYLQYIFNNKRPSIVTMSLGGGDSPALVEVVQQVDILTQLFMRDFDS